MVGKTELVDLIMKKENLNRKKATHILDVVLDTIMEATARSGKVAIKGFGKFEKKDLKIKPPKKDKPFVTKIVKFTAGETFKKKVREG